MINTIKNALDSISPAMASGNEPEMQMLYDVLGHMECAASIEDDEEREEKMQMIRDVIERMGD